MALSRALNREWNDGERIGMTSTDEPRRMGRPPKMAGDRKTETMRFRVREDLHNALHDAASKSQRTVNEEAEIRLENSFNLEKLHQAVYDSGDDARQFILSVINVISTVQGSKAPTGEQIGSPEWLRSPLTRAGLRSALDVLVDHFIPPPQSPEETPWTATEQRHYAVALELMQELGVDHARLITGQTPEVEEMLSRDESGDH